MKKILCVLMLFALSLGVMASEPSRKLVRLEQSLAAGNVVTDPAALGFLDKEFRSVERDLNRLRGKRNSGTLTAAERQQYDQIKSHYDRIQAVISHENVSPEVRNQITSVKDNYVESNRNGEKVAPCDCVSDDWARTVVKIEEFEREMGINTGAAGAAQ